MHTKTLLLCVRDAMSVMCSLQWTTKGQSSDSAEQLLLHESGTGALSILHLTHLLLNRHFICVAQLRWIRFTCTYLISHQTTQSTLPLCGNPSSDTDGTNFAWLGDHNVAGGIFLIVVVQNILWQLGGLATACGSSNYQHRVVFYEWNQLEAGTCTCTRTQRCKNKQMKRKKSICNISPP